MENDTDVVPGPDPRRELTDRFRGIARWATHAARGECDPEIAFDAIRKLVIAARRWSG